MYSVSTAVLYFSEVEKSHHVDSSLELKHGRLQLLKSRNLITEGLRQASGDGRGNEVSKSEWSEKEE
jgi:hypothetical protein